VAVWVAVGVGVAVGELLAEGDGVGDEETVGVGSALGVAGAVTLGEGSGEPDGRGAPETGWLVYDALNSTGVAGGGAAASAIPATIAARPPTAPAPSNTGVQEEPRFVPGSGPSRFVPGSGPSRFVPDSGPSAATGCLPVIRPEQPAGPRHRW
jgi:hypothetical protein